MNKLLIYILLSITLVLSSCSRENVVINNENLKGDYILSKDGNILLNWFNKETTHIDMKTNKELRSITVIGSHSFIYHRNLVSIIFPEILIKIGDNAFNRSGLINIEVPENVISIGIQAFYNNQLSSVRLSDNIEHIGNSSFSGNQLTSVTIGSKIKNIEDYAFANNPLKSIVIKSENPPNIGEDIFDGTPQIFIPNNSIESYKNHAQWSKYSTLFIGN